ncbi:condensation domain-containing protein, partial [Legionella oakridgensis]|uniref:condensation domain-containing protein n=1 Tax=Legionella oakridgensis TaxID=29423 RepID=UPI00056C7CCB
DRQALPKAELTSKTPYRAPRNELETLIAEIWKEILGIPRLSIDDDFFSLGGHSILAMQVTHRLSQTLQRELTVATLFQHRSIAQLSSALEKSTSLTAITPDAQLKAPLSHAQERLFFIENYEKGALAYHIPMAYTLGQTLDIDALKKAFQALVERHAVLRTTFTVSNQGKNLQVIQNKPLNIQECLLKESDIPKALTKEAKTPFDLSKDYPIRVIIYQSLDTKARFLLINVHHIAFDAWSRPIFYRELTSFYQAIHDGKPIEMDALPIQYKDFALWQRHALSTNTPDLIYYWQNKLAGFSPLAFPTDHPRPPEFNPQAENLQFDFPPELAIKLRTLAREQGLSLYTVLLTAFALTLSHYTGQTDLLIGTPLANRQHPDLKNLIGFFVNTLALRLQLNLELSLKEQLQHFQKELIEVQDKQDLPFEKLIQALNIERDKTRHPLVQLMFILQYDEEDDLKTLDINPLPLREKQSLAKFDLTLSIHVSSFNMHLNLQYATALFEEESMKRFQEHLEYTLKNFVDKPIESLIKTYPSLTPKEYQT